MSKDIKKINLKNRPIRLRETLLNLTRGQKLEINCLAYRPETVRIMCYRLNKKYGRKLFSVSGKKSYDSVIVKRS